MMKFVICITGIYFLVVSCSDQKAPKDQNSGSQQHSSGMEINDTRKASTPNDTLRVDSVGNKAANDSQDDPIREANLRAYIHDPDQEGSTNIRNAPNGTVMIKLAKGVDQYMVTVSDVKDGWFKVSEVYGIQREYGLPGEDMWIHGSVLGFDSRNYGGGTLSLFELPDSSSAEVYSFDKETLLKPMDIQGDWVEVRCYGGDTDASGWIHNQWLCGSAVTTCP